MRIKGILFALLFATQAQATPDIQHWQTANGARVFFVQLKELPIVDLQVTFDAGSARDPAARNGLAMLTNNLLGEAAAGLDADQLSFEFERLGAQYSANAGYDSASVSLRSLSDETLLKPALKNLHRILGRPEFLEDVLERQRNRLLIAIQRKQQSPGELASDAFAAAAYGDHPYAMPNEGDEETIKAIKRDDLQAFYKKYYVAANATISIAGNVSRQRAENIAGALAKTLSKGKRPSAIPAVPDPQRDVTRKITFPSTQTHILIGQPGMRFGDPDYFPLYVGNHILGGSGLTSLLFKEVREKRGLSYSAHSYFSPRRAAGPFVAGLQTRSDQAEQALAVMRGTIRDFIANGPSREQLAAARKNITGGFPLRIDSNSKILNYLSVIGFYGLPLDYLDTFIRKVEAVTAEDIQEAFQRRLDVDKFVTVMVGPQADGEPLAGHAAP